MKHEMFKGSALEGDKNNTTNLKLGEVRYYMRDNGNLFYPEINEVSIDDFISKIEKTFEGHSVEVNGGCINTVINSEGDSVMTNKGYVCIKEASPESIGLALYIHDADLHIIGERYNAAEVEEVEEEKTLDITDVKGAKKKISDIKVFGNGDLFQLIAKASSQGEGWMKSTKAMEVKGLGVTLQVSTQQGDNVAEALTFIPGAKIIGEGENREIVVI